MFLDTSCISRGTSCMSQDTFDVAQVAVCKHENDVEWLGAERDTPFPLSFQVLSTGSRPMAEEGLEKLAIIIIILVE